MTVRIGVVTFPGSLDDVDAQRAVRIAGAEPVALWHGSHDLEGVDALVLPGGVSYGDYLRAGAIAALPPNAFRTCQEIIIPLKNADGGYIADEQTLDRIEGEGLVAFRYAGVNPNGSLRDIAGLTNEAGNVVGLMPHPEHATEPGFGPDTAVAMRSGVDGLDFFTSAIAAVARVAA